MNRVTEICKLWVGLNAAMALQPTGGTRMKGSAHPKGDRSPGVARCMRLNERGAIAKANAEAKEAARVAALSPAEQIAELTKTQSASVKVRSIPLRREYPKGAKGRAPCPCNSGKKWKHCHMRAAAA